MMQLEHESKSCWFWPNAFSKISQISLTFDH